MTQYQKILVTMCREPNRWFLVSDFQRPNSGDLFVGYKASARINELEHDYPSLFVRQPAGRFMKRMINKEAFRDWFPRLTKDLQNVVARELNYYPQQPVED